MLMACQTGAPVRGAIFSHVIRAFWPAKRDKTDSQEVVGIFDQDC